MRTETITIHGPMQTEPGRECCAYCQNEIPPEDGELIPGVDDDDTWRRLAPQHAQGCEWIVTRAFRLAETR